MEIVEQTPEVIRENVRRLVHESDNPWLTGVCVINMDHRVRDEQIAAVFEEVGRSARRMWPPGSEERQSVRPPEGYNS